MSFKKLNALLTALFIFAGGVLPLAHGSNSRIIGGEVVDPHEHSEVVLINSELGSCSGVVVGERAVLTTAHCIRGSKLKALTVTIGDSIYLATGIQHPDYLKENIDLSLLITQNKIKDVSPISIDNKANLEDEIEFLGYGCSSQEAISGIDGLLRKATGRVSQINKIDFSIADKNASLCFGDSGGPAYKTVHGIRYLVGLGYQIDAQWIESYFIKTSSDKVRNFLLEVANENEIDICGISQSCY